MRGWAEIAALGWEFPRVRAETVPQRSRRDAEARGGPLVPQHRVPLAAAGPTEERGARGGPPGHGVGGRVWVTAGHGWVWGGGDGLDGDGCLGWEWSRALPWAAMGLTPRLGCAGVSPAFGLRNPHLGLCWFEPRI